MFNYRIKAVRLGVDSQSIANHGGVMLAIAAAEGREPTAAYLRQQAQARTNGIQLEERIFQLAGRGADYDDITKLALHFDPASFKAAVRQRARPYPRLKRPGPGIENLMIDSGAFTAESTGRYIDLDVYCDFALRSPSGPTSMSRSSISMSSTQMTQRKPPSSALPITNA
jgi:hypothetical protein